MTRAGRAGPDGGVMLLRYRGGAGMLAWAFHRIAGVALFLFILLHVLDIWLAAANPAIYDEVLTVYTSLPGRIGEALIGAALLYHALNGLRIIALDFWPRLTRYHVQLWYACWVVFFVVGIPGAYLIVAPALGLPGLKG